MAMEMRYSPQQQAVGRKWWIGFSFINTFGFQFLAGNVILLFVIRLGASNTLVGLVSSFYNLSYFIMPLGKILSGRLGLVRSFASAWFVRYFTFLPVVIAPLVALPATASAYKGALWMVLIGYFFFQMVRGMGMASLSPVLTEVSQGPDRGRFLSKARIVTDSAILLGSLAVALFLGEDAPIIRYFISFVLGFSMGFLAVYTLANIPEISRPNNHVDQGLWQSVRSIFKNETHARFFTALFAVSCMLGVMRPFLLVYVKDVYGFSDSSVLLLSVAGSIGAIVMGIFNGRILDRVGAKPMLFFWTVLMLASAIAVVIFGRLEGLAMWVFLIPLFFVSNMGLSGTENTVQTYFFGMISPEQQMSFGILYYLSMGISGVFGANVGGILLDMMEMKFQMGLLESHHLLFGGISVGLIITSLMVLRMKRLGSMSIGGSLSEIFRLRWRIRNQG